MEQTASFSRYKTLFSLLAVVVFVWGVIGTLDITNIPFAGYFLSPDNVVIEVRQQGPAEQAGLKVGDTVTKIDAIPIENFASLSNRDRPTVNSAGSISVKRGDGEETLNFTYGSLPMLDIVTTFGAFTLTGLAFLILGLMVYLKNPTRLSTIFCTLSLLFAAALFNTPYLTSPLLRRIISGILAIVTALLLAVILDYCLNFPRTKKIIAARPWLRQAIYVVLGATGVMLATINITTPQMNAPRQMILFLTLNLIFGGSLLLALIGVAHSYIKASRDERRAMGLNLMLAGMVIGFGPLLVVILARSINPQMGLLPGEQFYPLTLVAVPVGMAMALMRLEPAGVAIEAEDKVTG